MERWLAWKKQNYKITKTNYVNYVILMVKPRKGVFPFTQNEFDSNWEGFAAGRNSFYCIVYWKEIKEKRYRLI